MNKKGLILLSGGLDSILAGRLLLDQSIELEGLYFYSELFSSRPLSDKSPPMLAAKKLGIPLRTIEITDDHLKIVKNPKYGYGRNINPCVDCHLYMFKRAGGMMKVAGAGFIATGEVLGERPMSQRKDMLDLIEREAGLRGRLLRPLSAKLLRPTEAESSGAVDRERLLDISGRSRKRQLALAKEYGIEEYPTPAGGCLLTDPGFSKRANDLMERGAFTLENIRLLKVGRHFRLDPATKLIVGRNRDENERLLKNAADGDIIIDAKGAPGPIGLLKGRNGIGEGAIELSSRIIAKYSDKKENRLFIHCWEHPGGARRGRDVLPASEAELEGLRI